MAEDVTIIEITAQVSDKTEPSASKANESVGKLEKSMRKAQEQSDRMKKGSKIEVVANFMDNASKGLQKVMTVGKQLGGAVWTATASLLDKASHGIRGVASLLKGITGKAWGITMKLASAPLNAIKGIVSPILNGLGIAGGMGIANWVQNAVISAGETEQGTIAMRAVANSTGNNLTEVEAQKKAVMGMGIQEQEANQIMTRFMQGGLDINDAGKLARVAQDSAIISGGTSSEAAETMVEAIAKQNPAVLAQFGMTKNMNAIYQDYADELGIVEKTQDKYGKSVRHLTRDMTELEKKQATQNYILEEGEKLAGTYESALGTAFKKMGSLKRQTNELLVAVGSPLFLPAFGKVVDKVSSLIGKGKTWAEANQSLLENWGKKAVEWMDKGIEKASIWATKATSKIQEYAQTVKSVMDTTEFKDANLLGKAEILWDEIIAKPFAAWWESKGHDMFSKEGTKISRWLGEGLHGGIMALLGVEDEGGSTIISEAVGLGKEFADAFLKGFNGQEIWAAIVEKAKEAFFGIKEDAKTVLPGNETSSTGWLSAGLLTFAGIKLLAPLFKAGKGLFNLGKLFTGGGAGAAVAEAGGTAAAGTEVAAAGAAGVAGAEAAGTAGLVLSAVETGGVMLGLAGLVKAFIDAGEALDNYDSDKAASKGWAAGVEGSAVVIGTAIGTAIAPGVGSAIGAGIGGLVALFSGGTLGEYINSLINGDKKREKSSKQLQKSSFEYSLATDKEQAFKQAINEYSDSMENGGDLAKSQFELVEKVNAIYPSLISNYDIENGKLFEKLGLIRQITEAETAEKKAALEKAAEKGEKSFADVENKVGASLNKQKGFQSQIDMWNGLLNEMRGLEADYLTADTARSAGVYKTLEDENKVFDDLYQRLQAINEATGWNFNAIDFLMGDASTNVVGEISKLQAALESEREKVSKMESQYQDLYNTEVELLKIEYGDQLTQDAAKVEEFNKKLGELNTKFNLLPTEKKVAVTVSVTGAEKLSTLEQSVLGAREASTLDATGHAEGGILNRPHLGMVAEDGAEAIIPLTGKRRSRGLALWERAGEMLGVRPYAEGAIFNYDTIAPASLGMGGDETIGAGNRPGGAGSAGVAVTVENITFEVNTESGGGPEAIVQAIRENTKNITDELANQIAMSLRQVFANMPKAASLS